jgi:hypothetical protein
LQGHRALALGYCYTNLAYVAPLSMCILYSHLVDAVNHFVELLITPTTAVM